MTQAEDGRLAELYARHAAEAIRACPTSAVVRIAAPNADASLFISGVL